MERWKCGIMFYRVILSVPYVMNVLIYIGIGIDTNLRLLGSLITYSYSTHSKQLFRPFDNWLASHIMRVDIALSCSCPFRTPLIHIGSAHWTYNPFNLSFVFLIQSQHSILDVVFIFGLWARQWVVVVRTSHTITITDRFIGSISFHNICH